MDTQVPGCTCINCHRLVDGASDAFGDSAPEPGAITVCIYCGHVQAFSDGMQLRELTDEEMHEVAGDRRILAIQKARGKLIKNGVK